MWCAHCQSDVAAELSASDRRAICASCGGDLVVPAASEPTMRTRQALQLLERWSRPGLLDPFPRTGVATLDDEDEPLPGNADQVPVGDSPADQPPESSDEDVVPEEPAMSATEPTYQFHGAHGEAVAPPHYAAASVPQPAVQQPPAPTPTPAESADVRSALREESRTNWVAVTGQLLAYAGVAVLTIGTTLALWGYFADRLNYVPTGWLVASAGQMLLFLGVITLVSSGMEHASRELHAKFERVASKVDRVERSLAPPAQAAPPVYAQPQNERVAA